MEEEKDPSPEYIKKFNYGYMMQKHEPELLSKLITADNGKSEGIKAMKAGQKQYQREQELAKLKAQSVNQRTTERER